MTDDALSNMVLDNLNIRVSSLEWKVDSINGQTEEINHDVSELKEDLKEVCTDMKEIKDKVMKNGKVRRADWVQIILLIAITVIGISFGLI